MPSRPAQEAELPFTMDLKRSRKQRLELEFAGNPSSRGENRDRESFGKSEAGRFTLCEAGVDHGSECHSPGASEKLAFPILLDYPPPFSGSQRVWGIEICRADQGLKL
jgi:hypothetical protein